MYIRSSFVFFSKAMDHDNWIAIWQNNIDGFEDYFKADRVKFGGISVKDICK
ncbi:hypothetical protein QWZ13_03090 [Reinekea marina]|uniref:hypothetical protein n=1 Tax=Reinekea marina TaxID=1310421 RepID=UPI0025B32ACC|nr:hypothetical protein [Reinekea marina]MDN3647896.1 hypothetical protein [Reinekea marina]